MFPGQPVCRSDILELPRHKDQPDRQQRGGAYETWVALNYSSYSYLPNEYRAFYADA
ncbi:hypothetical protein D3C73_1433210 [compost metagenome]